MSLLFCGITLKHYAYFNMSRRTQLSTKYFFQVLAQLSENFIFIYLGLSLFTDPELEYRPDLIIVTVIAVCAARWVAVFPLSAAINWFIRYRARRRGVPTDSGIEDELPYSYQAMLFWAGLRGAVGVALAALLHDDNSYALKATVLVVVVLTVIIFGGTTSRMLEILGIRTGVVEEIDSDDEFDIETVGSHYYKRSGTGIGYMPPSSRRNGNASSTIALDHVDKRNRRAADQGNLNRVGSYVSGSNSGSGGRSPNGRKNSTHGRGGDDFERADLLGGGAAGRSGSLTESDIGSDVDTSDLPPPAPRGHSPSFRRGTSPNIVSGEGAGVRSSRQTATGSSLLPEHHTSAGGSGTHTPQSVAATATAAIRSLLTAEDHAALFRQLDEDFIKPKLLLDAGHGRGGNGGGHGGSGPL